MSDREAASPELRLYPVNILNCHMREYRIQGSKFTVHFRCHHSNHITILPYFLLVFPSLLPFPHIGAHRHTKNFCSSFHPLKRCSPLLLYLPCLLQWHEAKERGTHTHTHRPLYGRCLGHTKIDLLAHLAASYSMLSHRQFTLLFQFDTFFAPGFVVVECTHPPGLGCIEPIGRTVAKRTPYV